MRVRSFLPLVLLTASAAAQSPQLDLVAVSAGHRLLGAPLLGAAVSKRIAQGPGYAFRLRAEFSVARASRLGAPCGGMIQPGTCPPEPMRDAGRMFVATGGAEDAIFSRGPVSLVLTGDLGVGYVGVRSRGETSGRHIDADKVLLVAMVGAATRWTPSRGNWSVQGGIDLGALGPLVRTDVLDAYTPFEDGFTSRRFALGVIWTPGGQ